MFAVVVKARVIVDAGTSIFIAFDFYADRFSDGTPLPDAAPKAEVAIKIMRSQQSMYAFFRPCRVAS